MRGFVTISKVPEGPAAPLWCMARTLSPQRDCASPPTRITAGGGVPLCNASETILYVHNPCISFDSCDPQFRVSHHRAHHEGVAQASLWLWLGAPGRIRTCDTRFRKSLDSACYAVYLRLSYARGSQPSRHTTPDDPGSRNKPCHAAPPRCTHRPAANPLSLGEASADSHEPAVGVPRGTRPITPPWYTALSCSSRKRLAYRRPLPASAADNRHAFARDSGFRCSWQRCCGRAAQASRTP